MPSANLQSPFTVRKREANRQEIEAVLVGEYGGWQFGEGERILDTNSEVDFLIQKSGP
jgi:hypothetical protein